ncbi:GrpB family protein [Catellatospora sp. KI3]|uniref:GrpB family protein n=1 Tax=Catellatospora sp. KI3 TaxID=3041620 RepID=UPI002482BB05|nr:GrpB family protein [Catellatospora sp. KI3]MDI1466131.1 GrpB family protein [Catellatospora sp. KI3]
MSERRDPITIVAYDAAWPVSFQAQRTRIESALAGLLVGPVEHIGSTSVPGLAAKPIIDMLARVDAYDRAAAIEAAMAGIGWVHAPEPGDEADRKLSFCLPDVAHRTHHLHVVEAASTGWPTWLAFRDHLRAHPADAAAYGELKARLAAADDRDRPRYRAAKAPFIADVLHRITIGGSQADEDRP